jgi:hypothetical protein
MAKRLLELDVGNETPLILQFGRDILEVWIPPFCHPPLRSLYRGNNVFRLVCKMLKEMVDEYYKKVVKISNYMGIFVRNECLPLFQNLVKLDLSSNQSYITYEYLSSLTNLTNLCLKHNTAIKNTCLKKMSNLRELNIEGGFYINDKSLQKLVGLTSLNISYNPTITESTIHHLTNLTHLDMRHNYQITASGILCMKNLKTVCYSNDKSMKSNSRKMPNITGVTIVGKWINDLDVVEMLVSMDASYTLTYDEHNAITTVTIKGDIFL